MDRYTVITDGVIDDLVAMWLLYKLAPDADITVVSTFGNVPEDRAHKNSEEFISLVTNNWKLCHGASLPMNGIFEHAWLSSFNGPDGLWGVHPSKHETNRNTIKRIVPSQHIISLASLTETYTLVKHFGDTLVDVTIMGGVFRDKGNYTEYAECNIAYDPQAACDYFKDQREAQTRIIPLDVTRRVFWTEEIVDTFQTRHKGHDWMKMILKTWYEKYGRPNKRVFRLHDPLAVYLAFFPNEAIWEVQGVEVVLEGKQRGKTQFTSTNPNCHVAIGLRNEQKVSNHIASLLFDQ